MGTDVPTTPVSNDPTEFPFCNDEIVHDSLFSGPTDSVRTGSFYGGRWYSA